MAKNKSLTEQLEELQLAAEQLSEYQKLFDKACLINFGISAKSIKKMTSNDTSDLSEFEKKICNYFGLKTSSDKDDFISIMCCESSLKFFNSKRNNEEENTAEQE